MSRSLVRSGRGHSARFISVPLRMLWFRWIPPLFIFYFPMKSLCKIDWSIDISSSDGASPLADCASLNDRHTHTHTHTLPHRISLGQTHCHSFPLRFAKPFGTFTWCRPFKNTHHISSQNIPYSPVASRYANSNLYIVANKLVKPIIVTVARDIVAHYFVYSAHINSGIVSRIHTHLAYSIVSLRKNLNNFLKIWIDSKRWHIATTRTDLQQAKVI